MARSAPRIILSIALSLSVFIALGMRFLNEDLFVALCAGRDIVEGNLAQPDTWAFTTDGKVWVNQGWLSHLLLYVSYELLQDLGPVAWKAVLFLVCLAIMYARCHTVGASAEISLFALTVGTLSVAPFLQIRAENFGLIFFVLVTTLLTASHSWGWFRQIGIVLVMLVWANSHGSFVVGLALTGLKLLVEVIRSAVRARDQGPGETRLPGWHEPFAWGVTLTACFLVAALANPYGTANLFMPHRQVSAEVVTELSADWVPLLDWRAVSEKAFFHPLDAKPFLALVVLGVMLSAALLVTAGIRPDRRLTLTEPRGHIRWDVHMEVLIPLLVVPLTFLFRRIILFAGLSMIPLVALLAHTVTRAVRLRGPADPGQEALIREDLRAKIIASVIWLLLPAWIFFQTTLPPYLPGSPTRPDRPLIPQLMSFDSFTMDAIHFMKNNRIEGRLFTSWVISNFLLFHLPGIKVFMDCRDQSAYSNEVIQMYFATLAADPGHPGALGRALEILERHKLSATVMETRPIGFKFATLLMGTRKWACIYKDDEVFVLVPVDSDRFGSWVKEGKLPPLWYPNESTRSMSAALLAFSTTGKLAPDMRLDLERWVRDKPDPSVYGLLYLSSLEPNGCLRPEARPFFISEVRRLTALDPMTPGLGKPILESLIRLVSVFEKEEQFCSFPKGSFSFGTTRKALEERLAAMERKYLGYTP